MNSEIVDKKWLRLGYIELTRNNNQIVIQIALSILLDIGAIIILPHQQSNIEIALSIYLSGYIFHNGG